MKRRNRANRGRAGLARVNQLSVFANRNPRKRRSFLFETLEARHAFSTTPVEGPMPDSDGAAEAAAQLMRELQWASLQAASTNPAGLQAVARMLPTDPFVPNPNNPNTTEPNQWHLLNIGQLVSQIDVQQLYGVAGEDINVVGAWNLGYTGDGVLVAVMDDGVQTTHPDLFGNIHPIFRFNAITGQNDGNPPNFLTPSHGTAVAGLIGAVWSNEVFIIGNGDDDDDDDDGGTPVTNSQGGVGVAPEVTLVPIVLLGDTLTTPMVEAFRYAMMVGVDVTNNSWGPADIRAIAQLTPAEYNTLRDSVTFGRDGLGMVHVWASGNGGGSPFGPGFGVLDSATYDPFVSSRYVIGVTAVDHDGMYANADGTVTAYGEAGANVLVAAPSGSNHPANVIANDDGFGSGLWTTDLTGNFGYNAAADPITGIDDDRDFTEEVDYTSRFNGTSGAAPIVAGVVALMLDANPNLTYRDVQEILVRSSRQNAPFEIAEAGGGTSQATYTTWQTNQMGPFRDPDAFGAGTPGGSLAQFNPLADPTHNDFPYQGGGNEFYSPGEGNDFGRINGHYELQPAEFVNGAGYTVSQGYGVYNELIGYGHGVVDAELAVIMARDWHSLNQNSGVHTEKSFTTSVDAGFFDLHPAERGSIDTGFIVVPGGIGGDPGFIGFWNEYFADPPAPFDPANPDSWPRNTRGASYIDYVVPVNQQINVEWVEVTVTILGDPGGLDHIKMNLTSPTGMQSELNHYFMGAVGTPFTTQNLALPATSGDQVSPGGNINEGNTFTWTFSTNRSWGESTNGAIIINPLTGEPVAGPADFGGIDKPILRDWELHIENWGPFDMDVGDIEIVWHGKPIAGGTLDQDWLAEGFEIPTAQRIQGFVGIDANNDDEFSGIDPTRSNEWNNRYVQNFLGNPAAPRAENLVRRMLDDFVDNNGNNEFDEGDVRLQEQYAANVLVEAFRFTVDGGGNDIVEDQPIAQFLTGADGNYYFDLIPGNYYIRVTDRGDTPATAIDDPNTAPGYLQHYKDEWRITSDWFYAPNRDAGIDTNGDLTEDIPGEIFFDNVTQAPEAFTFAVGEPRIPMNVQNINFLLKPSAVPANEVVVSGTVWADVNADGNVDIFDAPAGNVKVYHDSIRNGQYDFGEQFVTTAADGTYSITILASQPNTFAIGVDLEPGWVASLPGGDQKVLFLEPGDIVTNQDFFANPPDDPTGTGPANITGFVFNDLDADGLRDPGENGIAGLRVFIDDPGAPNGMWDPTEPFAITASNGGYFFADVGGGTHRVDVQIDDEGTGAALYTMTSPELNNIPIGYRTVTVVDGATATNVSFGLDNRADYDWGDLPDTFNTTGGPSHFVVPHFRLGSTIDGEVDGQPTADALGDDNADNVTGVDDLDDGVSIFSGGGVLHPGLNTLEVTVFGVGGFLSGWIDWDNDGTFDSNERLSFTDATSGEVYGQEAAITPGTYKLNITAPAVIPTAQLGARFRWGEHGIGLSGQAFIGEVEDYYLSSSAVVIAQPLAGDYNDDGYVNAADYVLFRKLVGTQTSIPNGTNPNWVVPQDGEMWEQNYGASSGGSGGGGGSGQAAAPESDPPTELGGGDDGSIAGELRTDSDSVDIPAVTVETSPLEVPVASPEATVTSPVFASQSFVSVSFDTTALTSFATAADDVFEASVAPAESQSSDLLLLEEAWADLDDMDDEAAPITGRNGEDEDGYGDLELAAVFDDEAAWWTM